MTSTVDDVGSLSCNFCVLLCDPKPSLYYNVFFIGYNRCVIIVKVSLLNIVHSFCRLLFSVLMFIFVHYNETNHDD